MENNKNYEEWIVMGETSHREKINKQVALKNLPPQVKNERKLPVQLHIGLLSLFPPPSDRKRWLPPSAWVFASLPDDY